MSRGPILATHNSRARRILLKALADRGIEVIEGAGVKEVTPKAVVLDDGKTVPADEVVWCTQAAPQGWLAGAHVTPSLCFPRPQHGLRTCFVTEIRVLPLFHL